MKKIEGKPRSRARRDKTEKAIRKAAISLIARHGFEATSLRMIANDVGIQPGSLYNYISSKDDFLFDLIHKNTLTMAVSFEEINNRSQNSLLKLREFIRLHISFVADRQDEIIIGNNELRSLSQEHAANIFNLRDKYSLLLTNLLKSGIEEGFFEINEPRLATFAILAMLSDVSTWYRPDGALTLDELADAYTSFVFQMLDVRPQALLPSTFADSRGETVEPAETRQRGLKRPTGRK